MTPSKKQKIVWLHSHTLLSTGGTRFIFEVLKQLSEKYTIELVVEKSSSEWKSKFESERVVVTQTSAMTSTSIVYWLFLPYFLVQNYRVVKKILADDDIVISSMFPFNLIGSLLSSKHIFYCFEPFAFFYDKDLMKEQGFVKYILLEVLKTLYSWLDVYGTKKANKLLAINPSVGKSIKKIYEVTPNLYSYLGVDTKHFSPGSSSKKNKLVTFFHSTDYTPLKGTNYLINTLQYLKKYKGKFKVVISESIENMAARRKILETVSEYEMQDSLHFLGHLSYNDLPKEYFKSTAYLFLGNPNATGATSASLSVLEAQSCGLPVLRSIGNTDEIIDGKTGFYIDPRNTKELAIRMEDVIINPNTYIKMAKACRKHITSRYTWDSVAKVFIQSIESLQ